MRAIRVRRHIRLVKGQTREIPEHWRHIGEAEPEPVQIERDDRTGELFGDVETICAMAAMPDGAVNPVLPPVGVAIKGAEWRAKA